MSPAEATWLGNILSRFKPEQHSPLINLGRSSADYRKQACSEIENHILLPRQQQRI